MTIETINLIGILIILVILIIILSVITPKTLRKIFKKRIDENDICDNWEANNHKGPKTFVDKYSN